MTQDPPSLGTLKEKVWGNFINTGWKGVKAFERIDRPLAEKQVHPFPAWIPALPRQTSVSTARSMLEEKKSSPFLLMQCHQVANNAKLTKPTLSGARAWAERAVVLGSAPWFLGSFIRWLFNAKFTVHTSCLVSHLVAPCLLPQARACSLRDRLLRPTKFTSVIFQNFSQHQPCGALVPFCEEGWRQAQGRLQALPCCRSRHTLWDGRWRGRQDRRRQGCTASPF